jgi:molybdopterin biosynthesis enzyme
MCVAPPTVGVMSTGDELINAWDTPVGTQVRERNHTRIYMCTSTHMYVSIHIEI